ncbi:MAG: hypothetical protein HY903_14175 [Deltaproteobacteria bacterium]|nr:hypothetical protein [Deltaproteobacteria bacterium]
MPSSRPFLLTFLALAAGCGNDGLRHTDADVEVDPAVGFGEVFVGDLTPAAFVVRATGTRHTFVRAVFSDDPALTFEWPEAQDDARGTAVGPGTSMRVTVGWQALEAGPLLGVIGVRTDVPGKEVLLVEADGFAKPLPSCDDGNPCTDDWFVRATETCEHENNRAACNDDNACTGGDQCFDGACRGVGFTCDDDNVCTKNLCDPAQGCVYPPDSVFCDDADFCTKDLCDPQDGCSHPDADDGTPCGMFSCAVAHVCFFGDCKEIDVAAATDGLPCADGDPCTDPDTCQGGRCTSGPFVRRDPAIVGTYETFGGRGATVATDGFRYLFADRDAVRIAVLADGVSLSHVSTLPVVLSAPPVTLAPGKFIVAYNHLLALIDATDPAAPAFVWEVVADTMIMDSTESPGVVTELARAQGGVVYAIGVQSGGCGASASGLPASCHGPIFLPVSDLDATPGTAVDLGDDADLRDLDADGPYVSWVSSRLLHWMQLDPAGGVVFHAQHYSDVLGSLSRVSVRGRRVSTLATAGLQIYDVTDAPPPQPPIAAPPPYCPGAFYTPGCGEPPLPAAGCYEACQPAGAANPLRCPNGRTCQTVWIDPCRDLTCRACGHAVELCLPDGRPLLNEAALVTPFAGVEDFVVEAWGGYGVGPRGVEGFSICSYCDALPSPSAAWPVDTMAGHRLDRAGAALLVSGYLALPLVPVTPPAGGGAAPGEQAPPCPFLPCQPSASFARVSGERHGNVEAIVDSGATELLVVGPAAVGRIDLLAETVTGWSLTTAASAPDTPRAVVGLHRSAIVDSRVGPSHTMTGDSTAWAPWLQVVAADTAAAPPLGESRRLVGLHNGSADMVGAQIWAFTAFAAEANQCSSPTGIRAWDLRVAAVNPMPVFELPLGDPCAEPFSWTGRLRVADNQTQVSLALPVTDWSQCPGAGAPCSPRYGLHITSYAISDPSAPPGVPTATVVAEHVIFDTLQDDSMPPYDRVAVDGTTVLVGEPGRAVLYDSLSSALPASLAVANADPSRPITVGWMKSGRAWLGWQTGGFIDADIIPGPRLMQVAYSAGAGTLVSEGEVMLPAAADSVVDLRLYTIAATAAGVVVVAPACR